jgi:hypothetical protein
MVTPSINNPYALLALFISPWKNEEDVHRLSGLVRREKIDWRRLLYMANLHFCAPLWFSRLKRDGLLPLLPPELQIYLEHLHQANSERQENLRQSLLEIVSNLQDIEVPVILLKGAAVFCDELYDDPGARMMGDLDLLVNNRHIEPVRDLLLALGYEGQADCFSKSSGFFGSNAPHHLPRYLKSGTPVAVEIHFEAAQGQAGRAMPTGLCWTYSEKAAWEGVQPFVLAPTYRLLHNTVHALVPRRIYIDTSIISLSHLAEFACLVHRYGSTIDWRQWLERGRAHGMGRHFRVYLALAQKLMGVPHPAGVPRLFLPGIHAARISGAGSNRAADLAGLEARRETVAERIKGVAVRVHILTFRHLNRPLWEWYNRCYKPGLGSMPLRLLCLSALMARRVSLKKIFDFRALSGKLKKLAFLLKKPDSS